MNPSHADEARVAKAGNGYRCRVRHVLVVSTVERAETALRQHIGEDDVIKVVVPVVRQGVLDWIANDEKAYAHAKRVAEWAAEMLPGETVEANAGEADVELAIQDALATFPADEVVIAVRPEDQQGIVEATATESAPTRSINGIPVRLIVLSGS